MCAHACVCVYLVALGARVCASLCVCVRVCACARASSETNIKGEARETIRGKNKAGEHADNLSR